MWGEIDELSYLRGLVVHLTASVKMRFEYELSSEFFTIAACLEPRFKLHWVHPNKREEIISLVRKELTKLDDLTDLTQHPLPDEGMTLILNFKILPVAWNFQHDIVIKSSKMFMYLCAYGSPFQNH